MGRHLSQSKNGLLVLLCFCLSFTDNCASVTDNNTSLSYEEAALGKVDNLYWVFPKFIGKKVSLYSILLNTCFGYDVL